MPLAMIGLGSALALSIAAPAAPPPSSPAPRSSQVRTIYHKSKSFRVPFNMDAADRARLKEVQLWVSEDSGFTWKAKSIATPDRPSFTFRSAHDAEYWFAVRTVDTQGRLYPSDNDQVEPKLKVIVDTNPPSLVLDPDRRRGSWAAVRWEVRDEHLDLASLVLEYQVEGAAEWRQVPIVRPALIGSQSWDAQTAEPLKVRASVADRAGNTTDARISLPPGTPVNPGMAAAEASEFSTPPAISQISAGASFPPIDDNPPPPEPQDPFPARNASANPPPANDPDPFPADSGPSSPAPSAMAGGNTRAGAIRSLLVQSAQFPLKYAVEDAGPNGPNTVELWVTQDGGRTWARRGEDPDRVSPFPADLGGEGTFGLSLVARSAVGLGDLPPAPGDPPQFWVEVDSTPPEVQLEPARIGTGKYLGKVAIYWRGNDPHLGPRPVVLSWRTDQPGSQWLPITRDPIANSGRYIWTVPPNIPPRFHLKVEVADEAGNIGVAETPENGAVIVDRTRPRSRIIGLDPSARTGAGTSSRSLR